MFYCMRAFGFVSLYHQWNNKQEKTKPETRFNPNLWNQHPIRHPNLTLSFERLFGILLKPNPNLRKTTVPERLTDPLKTSIIRIPECRSWNDWSRPWMETLHHP